MQKKQEPSSHDIYIVVKDSHVTGIFKDKVEEKNRLKTVKAYFARYGDGWLNMVDSIETNVFDLIPRCLNTNVAVNTKDDGSIYYVCLSARKNEYWFEYDD